MRAQKSFAYSDAKIIKFYIESSEKGQYSRLVLTEMLLSRTVSKSLDGIVKRKFCTYEPVFNFFLVAARCRQYRVIFHTGVFEFSVHIFMRFLENIIDGELYFLE